MSFTSKPIRFVVARLIVFFSRSISSFPPCAKSPEFITFFLPPLRPPSWTSRRNQPRSLSAINPPCCSFLPLLYAVLPPIVTAQAPSLLDLPSVVTPHIHPLRPLKHLTVADVLRVDLRLRSTSAPSSAFFLAPVFSSPFSPPPSLSASPPPPYPLSPRIPPPQPPSPQHTLSVHPVAPQSDVFRRPI